MNTERWQRVGDIFERLLEVPEIERERRLNSLCGDDGELRGIVVSMLDSHESPRFSDASLSTLRDASQAAVAASQRGEPQRDTDIEGMRLGPWRLTRRIGAGGMGVVWLAERADGQFKQRAALKLIKRGMDSEAVLARFLRERQILARLEHRNIAHLLDGGIAPDGRPYFAMEYVEGLPLLEYCNERHLKLEERLRLFLQVCSALRFAHAQHVVHRDIKPSNILVTADGSVKLLDFGIAKLLQGEDELTSTLTGTQREQPMTPAYAAPEQIAGGKVSEATDVYALGVVFYELLSGRRPHDFSKAADAHDVLKIILATDPVAPGRLKLDSSPVPLKWLRGDLDTIAVTALRQMPTRRYQSVAAFAADIDNYLAGRPISARRDHVFYRAYKFTRRHRVGVAAVLAVALVALLGTGLVWRERLARGFIGTNASLALVEFTNLSKDREVNDWIAQVLAEQLASELAAGGRIRALPGELVRAAKTDLPAPSIGGYAQPSLSKLRQRVDADYVLSGSYFVSGKGGDATFRLDLALQDTLSGATRATCSESGNLVDLPAIVASAGASLREKVGIVEVSPSALQEVAKARPATFDLSQRMGNALAALSKGDPARARDELLEATVVAADYAPAHLYLSKAYSLLGYDAKALTAAQRAAANSDGLPAQLRQRIDRQLSILSGDWTKALDLDRHLLARDPSNRELHLDLVDDLISARKLDQADKAMIEMRKVPGSNDDPRVEIAAVKIADRREDDKEQLKHASLAFDLAQRRDEPGLANDAIYDQGRAHYNLRNYDEARRLMRQAIEGYKRLGNPRVEADARQFLAFAENKLGHREAALQEYQTALTIYQRIGYNKGVALVYQNLGFILWNQGDFDAAETAVRHAQQVSREIGNSKELASSLFAFAELKSREGAGDSVVADFREALDLTERLGLPSSQINVLQKFAEVLRLRGELDEAKKLCEIASSKAAQLNSADSTLAAEYRCAVIELDRGELADSKAAFARARALAEKLGYGTTIADIDISRARVEIARHGWSAAQALLQSAAQTLGADASPDSAAVVQSLLALCYTGGKQTSDRDQARLKARALRDHMTEHRKIFDVDLALGLVAADEAHQGATEFEALAQDAEKRSWLGNALEARFAAWQVLKRKADPSAAALQKRVEATARQHGFNWLLARMNVEVARETRSP